MKPQISGIDKLSRVLASHGIEHEVVAVKDAGLEESREYKELARLKQLANDRVKRITDALKTYGAKPKTARQALSFAGNLSDAAAMLRDVERSLGLK